MFESSMSKDDKIKHLENVLEKALTGPYSFGIIKTGKNKDGFCRLSVQGNDVALQLAPGVKVKEGDEVMINGHFIVGVVDEEMVVKIPAPEFKPVKWEDIAGMSSQIERIKEAVELPLKNSKLYKEFGVKPISGLILNGPPGCGKTTIGRAIMGSVAKTDKPGSFIYVKGGELLHPYVGMAERSIKEMFTAGREFYKKYKTKSVIFIDEAEALLSKRGSGISSDVDKTIVATFLAEMDGEENCPLMILSTNYPERLDPAIRRDGRIDLEVEVERPGLEDSIEIFELYLKKTITNESVSSLAKVAAETMFANPYFRANRSGAMIENIVRASSSQAIKRHLTDGSTVKAVTKEDIKKSFEYLKNEARLPEQVL